MLFRNVPASVVAIFTIAVVSMNILANKTIYQDKDNLSKYLLFGTTKEQKKYKKLFVNYVADNMREWWD